MVRIVNSVGTVVVEYTYDAWGNILGFKDISFKSAAECDNALFLAEIDTPEEKAHFFAQCAHETNCGQWLVEIGDEAYFADKEYGYKYRGAGYIQLTWESNYKEFAEVMGDPEIYNQGADYVAENYAWQAAAWFWSKRNMNSRIEEGASVKDITKLVRGSSGTWEKRQEYYDKFIEIFEQ